MSRTRPSTLAAQPRATRHLAVAALATALAGAFAVPAARAADPAAAMAMTGTKYKAHADMQAVLDQLASMGGKPIETLSAEEARQQPSPADAVQALIRKKGGDPAPTVLVPGITAADREIPGPAGPLPVRVYTPAGKGPFPVVVYFHGGGWVIADKDTYDGGARGLSKQANAIVVSVDYRHAPEARFPAQWDDSLAAYKWVAANAASLNGDPTKLGLAGESAGGNLSVATAVAARDAGVTMPKAVLSVYPIGQASDFDTASYRDSAKAKPLNKAMMEWFIDKTISKPGDKTDPRLDLVHADLHGLPPVTIVNAQIDPLREDGAMLAAALKKAGVKVDRKLYPGTTHEFFGMAAVVKDAAAAQAYAGKALATAFAK